MRGAVRLSPRDLEAFAAVEIGAGVPRMNFSVGLLLSTKIARRLLAARPVNGSEC